MEHQTAKEQVIKMIESMTEEQANCLLVELLLNERYKVEN